MKLTVDLTLTPAQLAEQFCDYDAEAQAQFFIEIARIMTSLPKPPPLPARGGGER